MKKLLYIAISIFALASCQREIDKVPVYELGCPERVRHLNPEAAVLDFVIYAKGEFEGKVNNSWITVEEFAGKTTFKASDDCTLHLSVTHNTEDTRTGTVTLSLGTRKIDLTIIQKGDKTQEVGLTAEAGPVSSSTLNFSFGEGESVEENYSNSYWFGLYRDQELTDLVVRYYVEGGSSIWNKARPSFTFAGLDKNTTYYFAAIDSLTLKACEPVASTTTDFTVVYPSAEAAAGDVILAEDFSLLCWNGDEIGGGAGFRAADISYFHAPEGECPEGGFGNRSFENQMLYKANGHLGEAASKTRLKDWSVLGEEGAAPDRVSMAFARTGYFKLGGYSFSAGIVTPALSSIPKGKEAKVKVTFTASRYSSDSENAIVSVVRGSAKDNVFTLKDRKDYQMDLFAKVGWNKYIVEFDEVHNDCHILIGPDYKRAGTGGGAIQHRMFIDDITVELVELYDDIKPTEVAAEKVFFTEATIKWARIAGVAYNVYVNGEKVTDSPVEASQYHVEGLKMATEYTVKVEAVTETQSKMSDEITLTTKNVRVVEQNPTHVCVEWDDFSGSTLWSGAERAYEMVVYTDEACTDELVTLMSFDGVKTNYFAFGDSRNSATSTTYWNGRLDGTARMLRTRISVGCLTPDTRYWFRVRSRESVAVENVSGTPYTVTNPAGTSAWSEPVVLQTTPVHTPAAKEVIFQGWDKFCVQRDQHNQCPGLQPRFADSDIRKAFTGTSLPYENGCALNTIGGQGDAWAVYEFGWAKQGTAADNSYESGSKYLNVNHYIDESGWHYGGKVYCEMGYVQIDAANNNFVGTPRLYDNLSADATECTLTFGGFANFASYNTTANKPIKIIIVHTDGTTDEVKCGGIPYKFENSSPNASNFVYDTTFKPVSVDLTLVAGDAVLIVSGGANRCMIDNIQIVAK